MPRFYVLSNTDLCRGIGLVADLAWTLAATFHEPEAFLCPIHELLINAVEHGNLGLGFDMKRHLLRCGRWQEEIERRLQLPENKNKAIRVHLSDGEKRRLVIADAGAGFCPQNYLEKQSTTLGPNGYGLRLAFSGPFDDILFNDRGNVVTCCLQVD